MPFESYSKEEVDDLFAVTDDDIVALARRVRALETAQPPTEPDEPVKPPVVEPPAEDEPTEPVPEPSEPTEPVPEPPQTGDIAWIPAPEGWRNPIKHPHEAVINLQEGATLSGTVDFGAPIASDIRDPWITFGNIDVPEEDWTLAVDNVPLSSLVLDTTRYSDGPHVLVVLTSPANAQIQGTAKVVVINNSDTPIETDVQPISPVNVQSNRRETPAFVRAKIRPRKASPLPWHWDRIPDTLTDADRDFLQNEALWVVEGLTHQHPTGLYQTFPYLVRNNEGSHFVSHVNPQDNGFSRHAVDGVSQMPAHDGPRDICDLNPYSTLVHGHHTLANGHMGWLGVTIDGRVMDVDTEGGVTTWFGPRSVGVDSDNMPRTRVVKDLGGGFANWHVPTPAKTLDERIASGEKEFVGDDSDRLWVAQDIWHSPTDPDIHCVADTGNNRVAALSRSQAKIVRSLPLKDVSSVWMCDVLAAKGYLVAAVNPEGLTLFSETGEPAETFNIPGAFWVRGKDSHSDPSRSRIWVMTDRAAIYEVILADMSMRKIKDAETGSQRFIFFDVDVNGLIGSKNLIYYSYFNSPGSNTSVHVFDPYHPGDGYHRFGYQAHPTLGPDSPDKNGHYLWGFALHHHIPGTFLTVGASNSSFLIHRAYVGEQPQGTPRRADFNLGKDLFRNGKKDVFPPLSTLFGGGGSGAIGYSVDDYRGMSFEEARTAMLPVLPVDHLSAAEIDALAGYIWSLRTQDHF